jgi:hypothetical protein
LFRNQEPLIKPRSQQDHWNQEHTERASPKPLASPRFTVAETSHFQAAQSYPIVGGKPELQRKLATLMAIHEEKSLLLEASSFSWPHAISYGTRRILELLNGFSTKKPLPVEHKRLPPASSKG